MGTAVNQPKSNNVIDIFTGANWVPLESKKIIRLAPEIDGLEMLYTNKLNTEKLYAIKILCWALRANGDVVAMVPWLNKIVACEDIDDPLHGRWEGYYDSGIEDVFFEPPAHKGIELATAADYYQYDCDFPDEIVQEIPDTIGTHAVLSEDGFQSITLSEVVSWQLRNDGELVAMLINESEVSTTPVLPGDDCLYPSNENENFQYFFQHGIANKLKEKDPEAIAAIALLMDKTK